MQIFPAVLEKTPEVFFAQIQKLKPYFKLFQVDIADGQFVPNTTVQIEELSEKFEKESSQFKNLTFDFHLMVKDYKKNMRLLIKLQKYIRIGNVYVHFSLSPDLQQLKRSFPPFSTGLVLDASDQVKDVVRQYNLERVPFIQIMTIQSGFQGNPFIEELLLKIEQLRKIGYRSKIYLDGAVNDKTLPIILSKKYKPDGVGVGSFFSKAQDVKQALNKLQLILETMR